MSQDTQHELQLRKEEVQQENELQRGLQEQQREETLQSGGTGLLLEDQTAGYAIPFHTGSLTAANGPPFALRP